MNLWHPLYFKHKQFQTDTYSEVISTRSHQVFQMFVWEDMGSVNNPQFRISFWSQAEDSYIICQWIIFIYIWFIYFLFHLFISMRFYGVTLYVSWYISYKVLVVIIKTNFFVSSNKFFVFRWIDIYFILYVVIQIIQIVNSLILSSIFQNYLFYYMCFLILWLYI